MILALEALRAYLRKSYFLKYLTESKHRSFLIILILFAINGDCFVSRQVESMWQFKNAYLYLLAITIAVS